MRNFMEAYAAVHSKEAKEELDSQRDPISEMNTARLQDNDLRDLAEEVLEEVFKTSTVKEAEDIIFNMIPETNIVGREEKLERIYAAFGETFSKIRLKNQEGQLEEFAKYRQQKRLEETWSARHNQDKRVARVHSTVIAEDKELIKRGLLDIFEKKKNDPCWDRYEQKGMKKKGGKMVPNCVPMEAVGMHRDAKTGEVVNKAEVGKTYYPNMPKKKSSVALRKEKEMKKEEVEVDEAMRPGPRQSKMAQKQYDQQATSRDRATAHNVAVRNDGPGTDSYEKKSTGGKGARYAGYGDQGAGNKARRRMGEKPLRGDTRKEEFVVEKGMNPGFKAYLEKQKNKGKDDKGDDASENGARPDYLDFDKDGDENESMKKALKDKKHKKMKEDLELSGKFSEAEILNILASI